MNTVWIIILAVFCALGGYIIGVRRGYKNVDEEKEEELDRGYKEGFEAGMNFIPPKHTWIASPRDLEEIIRQLDELFEAEPELKKDLEGLPVDKYGRVGYTDLHPDNEIHRTLDKDNNKWDCGEY